MSKSRGLKVVLISVALNLPGIANAEKLPSLSEQAWAKVQSLMDLLRWPQWSGATSNALVRWRRPLVPGELAKGWPLQSLVASSRRLPEALEPRDLFISVNLPNVRYFRANRFHETHLRSGRSRQLSLRSATPPALGMETARMQIDNRRPNHFQELYVPVGFRPLPSARQLKNLRIVMLDGGDYLFKSPQKGMVDIALTHQNGQALSTEELVIYSRLDDDVPFHEWPKPFREGLRSVLEVLTNQWELSAIQKSKALGLWLQKFFVYTTKGSQAKDVVEVTTERQLQCTWAATLWVALTRKYLGLPARLAVGFVGNAHQNFVGQSVVPNEALGHAWGEVYDFVSQVWIPVEATPSQVADGERANPPSSFRPIEDEVDHGVDSLMIEKLADLTERREQSTSGFYDPSSNLLRDITQRAKSRFGDIFPKEPAEDYERYQVYRIVLHSLWSKILRQGFAQSYAHFLASTLKFLEAVTFFKPTRSEPPSSFAFFEMREQILTFVGSLLLIIPPDPHRANSKSLGFLDLCRLQLIAQTLVQYDNLTLSEKVLQEELSHLFKSAGGAAPTEAELRALEQTLFRKFLPGPIARRRAESLAWDSVAAKNWLKQMFLAQILRPYQASRLSDRLRAEERIDERVLMSDFETHIDTADEIDQRSRIIRNGWSPQFDLFRMASDSLEQRYHLDVSARRRPEFASPQEALVVRFDLVRSQMTTPFQRAQFDLALDGILRPGQIPAIAILENETGPTWIASWNEILATYDRIGASGTPGIWDERTFFAVARRLKRSANVRRIRLAIGGDKARGDAFWDNRFDAFGPAQRLGLELADQSTFVTDEKITRRMTFRTAPNYYRSIVETDTKIFAALGIDVNGDVDALRQSFLSMAPLLGLDQDNVQKFEASGATVSAALSGLQKSVADRGAWSRMLKVVDLIADPPWHAQAWVKERYLSTRKEPENFRWISEVLKNDDLSFFVDREVVQSISARLARDILRISLEKLPWRFTKDRHCEEFLQHLGPDLARKVSDFPG